MKKMKIFIASSSGALIYAKQLAAWLIELDKSLDPKVWDEEGEVFELSQTYIESLTDALSAFDFAILLFHPDDQGVIKGKKISTTRDNVIFEYGLFMGKLGREKCYVVQPNNIELRIPSDLLGVHNATYLYENTDDPEKVKTLMKDAAQRIKNRISEVSQIRKARYGNFQIVKNYIHLTTTQREIYTKLEYCIRDGITLPEEILYWSVESAIAWLNYEQETFQNANVALANVAKYIDKNTPNDKNTPKENLHFVSLGCGSGEKDILIMNLLSPNKRLLNYFPIEQSYTLLENAIDQTLSKINAEEIFVNGIRADFRQISSFQQVFKKKHTRNIYSLLGRTLGNYDEVVLLNAIYTCMEPGDYLILELGLLTEEIKNYENGALIDSGKYADKKLQDFLLSPLKSFVKKVSRESITFKKDSENVYVKNSVRVIVGFDNKALPKQSPFDIAYSTHYDLEELVLYLKENHELDTVYKDTRKGNIYLVCQKPV